MRYKKGTRVKPHIANMNVYIEYLRNNGMGESAANLQKIVNTSILTVTEDTRDYKWESSCPLVNNQLTVDIDDKFYPWSNVPSNLVMPIDVLKREKIQ